MNAASPAIEVIRGGVCHPEGAFQPEHMATPWVGKNKNDPSPEGAI
jgi:hypothetical protein